MSVVAEADTYKFWPVISSAAPALYAFVPILF